MAKRNRRYRAKAATVSQLVSERPYLAQVLANPPLPGTVVIAHVYHDDYCAIWHDGRCNCNVQVTYEYPNLRGKR